jgi:hypothetical protein
MDTARLELKPGTRVRILAIGGDLRLTGVDSLRLEAQAGRRGGLRVTSKGDAVELTCDGGCLVFLPADCRLEIGRVAGDGRVTDMTGPVTLESVEGDLRLRRLGELSLGRVGGDLLAQRVRGGLSADSVGGDARLEKAEGDVRLTSVGGDLRVAGLEGGLRAKVGGDALVNFSPPSGSHSAFESDGDVKVRVPPGCSLRAALRADGDLRVDAPGSRTPGDRSVDLVLGGGEAELTASARGDLDFSEAAHTDPADLAGAITSQVEAALYEAEAALDSDLPEESQLAAEVTDQVRRALDRVRRREREEAVAPAETVDTARERQMILDMLAEHRITVDEAEALFRALENQA